METVQFSVKVLQDKLKIIQTRLENLSKENNLLLSHFKERLESEERKITILVEECDELCNSFRRIAIYKKKVFSYSIKKSKSEFIYLKLVFFFKKLKEVGITMIEALRMADKGCLEKSWKLKELVKRKISAMPAFKVLEKLENNFNNSLNQKLTQTALSSLSRVLPICCQSEKFFNEEEKSDFIRFLREIHKTFDSVGQEDIFNHKLKSLFSVELFCEIDRLNNRNIVKVLNRVITLMVNYQIILTKVDNRTTFEWFINQGTFELFRVSSKESYLSS